MYGITSEDFTQDCSQFGMQENASVPIVRHKMNKQVQLQLAVGLGRKVHYFPAFNFFLRRICDEGRGRTRRIRKLLKNQNTNLIQR